MPAKTLLRRQLRQARQNLPARLRRQATVRISHLLKRLLKRRRRIGVYWAVGSELMLNELIHSAWARGTHIYLPYIEAGSKRLWFTPYHPHSRRQRSHTHSIGIPQFEGHKIRAHQLHTIIVPLVGIDQQGYRLGQGGGYYDVTLAHTRSRLQPHTIGVGFSCQQVASIPHEAHDIPLQAFVCETGWQRFEAQ